MKKFHLVRISWYLYSIDMFFSVLNKWHNITFTSFESKHVYVCSVLICSFVFVEYTRCPAQALNENCEIRGPGSGVQGPGWGLYCHIVKVHKIFSSPIYIREPDIHSRKTKCMVRMSMKPFTKSVKFMVFLFRGLGPREGPIWPQ